MEVWSLEIFCLKAQHAMGHVIDHPSEPKTDDLFQKAERDWVR